MAKTLTDIGIQKIGQRFVDSVDHAAFTLNGQPKTVQPFRKIVSGSDARVYVYFDDTVIVTSPTWSSSTLTATSWRVLAIGSSPRHRARGSM